MRNQHQTILVPTFPSEPKKAKQIDVSKLTQEDIRALEKDDPFLYYSIPGVSKARLLCEPIDFSNLASSSHRDDSCSGVVSRRSRLSTECDFALLFKDFWDGVNEDSCLGSFDACNTPFSSSFDAISSDSGLLLFFDVESQAA
eukprot:CCRYP_009783-RA/>CCRYP_009783-RA protein AED:0.24 eAED:0.24 QI:0/-1/0/1/-1/1/1/0/142